MKILLFMLLSFFATPIKWTGNFKQAKSEASGTNKLILINFSGSDWCGPCIRLRKDILESASFEDYAAVNLVLVRADFPRQKKNQLSSEQVSQNELLADRYNPEGKFPFTLLVDMNGKVLKTWDGYPNELAEKFVSEIKLLTNVSN